MSIGRGGCQCRWGLGRGVEVLVLWSILPATIAWSADPRAADRFRAAAALEQRALYDLAADEYAAVLREYPEDPIALRCRLERGVCLFELGRFADAHTELAPLRPLPSAFAVDDAQRTLAYLGLAAYNGSRVAGATDRNRLLDEAIEVLQESMARFPDGKYASQGAFYTAEAHYARGHLAASATAYRALLTRFPHHPQRAEALYGLGVAEAERAAWSEAIAAFAELERTSPQYVAIADARARHADAMLRLADARFNAGALDEARTLAATLRHEFPHSALVPASLLVTARVAIRAGDSAAAAAALDECIRRVTQSDVSSAAHLLRARLRFDRGEFAESRADAEAALSSSPTLVEAIYVRALCLEQLGESAAAATAFRHLVDSQPTSPFVADSCYHLGEAAFNAGDYTAALKLFHKAHSAAEDRAVREAAAHQLGWCHLQLGDVAAAQAAFQGQLRDDPAGPLATEARALAAECAYKQGQFRVALDGFSQALADDSLRPALRETALADASAAALELHEPQRALETADQYLATLSDTTRVTYVHCQRGQALYELGRLDEAERELTPLASCGHKLLAAKAELTLARIRLSRHEVDAAVRLLFKVAYGNGGPQAPAALHACQAEAMLTAAAALESANRPAAAAKLYQELVRDYPASPHVEIARQSLERTQRR